MSLYKKDVIMALSTPRGVGAIAVIRVSGSSLKELFFKLSNIKAPKNRYVYNVSLKSKAGLSLDNVLITYYKSPSSFTGEDVVEISCHGGGFVSDKILAELSLYGCRYANPGEFSKRAFLNGKIDLIQAESINSIIQADSSEALNLGLMGLEGATKVRLEKIKKRLINLISIIEHELDFTESEIIETKKSSLKNSVKKIISNFNDIIEGSLAGKKIKDGVRVSIVGPPNAGKSTLFNFLIGNNKAIVSSEKGTTRDSLECFFEIQGVPVILVDTAGFWEGKDALDRLGIKKTKKEIEESDIVIVLDEKNPVKFLKTISMDIKNVLFVLSKADINGSKKIKNCISISCLKDKGVKELLTCLSTKISTVFLPKNRITYSKRQLMVLNGINKNLRLVYGSFEEIDLVQVVSLLREALSGLGEVVGDVYNEDILDNLFSSFCVGK